MPAAQWYTAGVDGDGSAWVGNFGFDLDAGLKEETMFSRGNASNWKRAAGVLMALGLVAGACSSDSDDDSDTETMTAEELMLKNVMRVSRLEDAKAKAAAKAIIIHHAVI